MVACHEDLKSCKKHEGISITSLNSGTFSSSDSNLIEGLHHLMVIVGRSHVCHTAWIGHQYKHWSKCHDALPLWVRD